MKFSDMHYERVDFPAVLKQFDHMIDEFVEAKTLQEEIKLYQRFDAMRSYVDSQYGLLRIYRDLDQSNAMYREEMEYMQIHMPAYETCVGEFYQSICESVFRDEWDEILGTYRLAHIEKTMLLFHIENTSEMDRIHQIMQEEERYVNLYETLRYQMHQRDITQEKRREMEAEIQLLFDSLVKKRDELAKVCGYSDYIQLYANSKGYDKKRNKNLHQMVKTYLVPLAEKMKQDDPVRSQFPIINEEASMDIVSKIFHDLSKETGAFIDFMIENDFLQVHDGKQKAYETYMIYLEAFQAPIIVSDYRNRQGLFHECGHAFQHYLNRNEPSIKRASLDYEINEAQALSMEFFVGCYMSHYGVDVNAYGSYQLKEAIQNVCNDCMRDEFECMIYEHPEMTMEQRNVYWTKLEKVYFPQIQQQNCHDWMYIEQYFTEPLYNISYAYAQIVALEFYTLMHQNFSDAFDRYIKLCRSSGDASFEDILHMCHMHSTFDEKHLKKLSMKLQNAIDDFEELS